LLFEGIVKGGTERNENSIAAARLKLIKKDILDRLSSPYLHIDAVARRQGITARYVQRLFENDGTTFSDFVRERRLDLVLALLEGPGRKSHTIASIAADAGFSDIASFNRAFRNRFGTTPSQIRASNLFE
jgi:AraC-like DNA-binding protein